MNAVDITTLSILVIDDDTVFLNLIEGMLKSLGVKSILRATSGADAVAKLKEAAARVDCVLCDYSMANGNGLQLLQAVRLGQLKFFRPDVCFVLVTASAQPGVVQTALELDVSGYIVKPVTAEKLKATIVKARSRYFILNLNKYADVILPVDSVG